MSDSLKEQHPLLFDDVSDEEYHHHFNSHQSKGIYSTSYRGRSKPHVTGAAAIITRWPEHWSSSLTYWWLGLGMITITIFIIYNGIVALAILPPAYLKATKPRATSSQNESLSMFPEVLMHIFVVDKEEIDFNKVLSCIEITANKYPEFNYNLIVVLNDTSKEEHMLEDEGENNQIALESLWANQKIQRKREYHKSNIYVEHIILSNYLNNSPLKKYWRYVPYNFVDFLVRAVSVWEKGGIALNPLILTLHSPHDIYVQKLQYILQKYTKTNKKRFNEIKADQLFNKTIKKNKTFNNIRDIIDALENESITDASSQQSIIEAAEDNIVLVKQTDRKSLSPKEDIINNGTKTNSSKHMSVYLKQGHALQQMNKTKPIYNFTSFKNNSNSQNKLPLTDSKTLQVDFVQPMQKNDTLSFLPLFLKYLFNEIPKYNQTKTQEMITNTVTRKRKSVMPKNELMKGKNIVSEIKKISNNEYNIDSLGISTKEIKEKLDIEMNMEDNRYKEESAEKLTIDLKGNIIATNTACHAFIGTIFSNVIHHTKEETITDFIIKELSIYCKGFLSSCKGIEVILL